LKKCVELICRAFSQDTPKDRESGAGTAEVGRLGKIGADGK